MELPHTSKLIHKVLTFNHVLEHCIHIDCYFVLCLLSRGGTRTGGSPLRWRSRDRTSSARQAKPHWSCR